MTLDWSEPINWIIVVLLVAVLAVQLVLLLRNQSLAPGRKNIRLGLNIGLWLILTAFVLKPTWNTQIDPRQALLAADDVPNNYLNQLKDSLQIQQSFRPDEFKGEYQTVTLVGQDFPEELLSRLSQSSLRWIPYYTPNQLQGVQWKGMLRKGELQRITGSIQSTEKQNLRIRFGNRTLDSLEVNKGQRTFTLQFPTFAQGRTEAILMLGDKAIDTIRFFAQPTESLAYQFILNNPDFESKTLADWLGRQGNAVQLTSTVAKGVGNDISINRTTKSKTVADIIITSPDKATDPVVKKAVTQGKSVLFINLTSPEADVKTINQALGSNWRVRKVSNEEHIPIGNGLTALPYQFVDAANQQAIPGWPVAVQRNVSKVGVSLLSETFPLKLSGDSLHYGQLWASVLAQLQPSYTNNVQIDAPVYRGIRSLVRLNNWPSHPQAIRLGTDTLSLTYSAINPQSAETTYRFPKSGWQSVQDSMAVYVDETSSLARARLVSEFVAAHSDEAHSLSSPTPTVQQVAVSVPLWVWLVLFLVCFSALWLEPKLG